MFFECGKKCSLSIEFHNSTPSDWERALSFLARTAENEVAAKASFTFAQNLVYENRAGGVQADNFGSVISVLSAFAIIAGQKDMPSDPSLRCVFKILLIAVDLVSDIE